MHFRPCRSCLLYTSRCVEETGYYLTTVRENEEGAGKVFRDENEALMAYAEHIVTLHAPIKVRRTMVIDGVERTGLVDATVGRKMCIRDRTYTIRGTLYSSA